MVQLHMHSEELPVVLYVLQARNARPHPILQLLVNQEPTRVLLDIQLVQIAQSDILVLTHQSLRPNVLLESLLQLELLLAKLAQLAFTVTIQPQFHKSAHWGTIPTPELPNV